MKRTTLFLLILLTGMFLYSDIPIRQEQLIYTVLAFNGTDYAGTFSGEDSDSLYLIAEVDSFLSVRNTLVFFWPITQELKTDTKALNEVFAGSLEITSKNMELQTIPMTDFTYYNVSGEYELNWKVDTNEAAHAAYRHYSDLIDAYRQSVTQYQQELAAYESLLNELTKRSTEFREQGYNFDELLKTMKPPEEPQFPRDYIVPPGPVQKAFILNLPVGEYQIRFINEDGTIMEGSERNVVTFKKRREDGISLEVIPGDKWTRPVESRTKASVIYVDGSTDLYLRPYFQNEYNDLYYNKMRNNDAKGNPNIMKWVRIQQVPRARMELIGTDRNIKKIVESPFFVEQVKGAALGYKIVPYDPEGAHKDRDPSLQAFHVALTQGTKLVRINVQDKEGTHLAESGRQIRVVSGTSLSFILLIMALLPIVIMLLVLALRSRSYTE